MTVVRKKKRDEVYNKYNGHCAYCGIEITQPMMQVDHITPVYSGGTDDMDNLNPACRMCNNHKLNFSLEAFRKELELQVERARKTSFNFRTAERYGLVEVTYDPIIFYFEEQQ